MKQTENRKQGRWESVWEKRQSRDRFTPSSVIWAWARPYSPISSPTFTIVQVYDEGRMPFYHFDVYRIGDIEEMDEIGYEDCFYGEGVCLIEWANLIEEILPKGYTRITIEKCLDKGFDYRKITIEEMD